LHYTKVEAYNPTGTTVKAHFRKHVYYETGYCNAKTIVQGKQVAVQ